MTVTWEGDYSDVIFDEWSNFRAGPSVRDTSKVNISFGGATQKWY